MANLINSRDDDQIPILYWDMMKHTDLWLEPITRKYNMLKKKDIWSCSKTDYRNVVELKWVFAIK